MLRVIKPILTAGLLYVLPIIHNGDSLYLLGDIRVWLSFFFCLILLVQQGEVSISETFKNAQTDKFSTLGIFTFGFLSQISAVVEWKNSADPYSESMSLVSFTGLILLFIGMIIRADSIYKLKDNFTPNVIYITKARLIKDGIFGLIRHPSYLGAYFTMIGTALLFESLITFIVFSIILLLAYAYRIYFEEKQLLKFFKNKYLKYKKRTWKMFPYIW